MSIPKLTYPANEKLPASRTSEESSFFSSYQLTEKEYWKYYNLAVIPKKETLIGSRVKTNEDAIEDKKQ